MSSSETCCCGCTLGQGTLIIGIINVIAGVISVIKDSIAVNAMIFFPGEIKDPSFQTNPSRYISYGFIQIFIAVVYLILSCLMVHGCRIKNHRLIMPWLIWTYVCLFLGIGFAVIMLVIFAFAGQIGAGLLIFVIFGVILGVQTYFLSVVRRFAHNLKRDVVED
ncbi:uncharacterized protein LOC110850069 [Folsomia candida]|uniref:uncharacterized protein LOC110850069 n=1 Tax=Folsomia candida TaxID=158441 RepID=UPI000B8FF496|nr:uncharacterized protein LOC110850069 [Folsomia candida]